MSLLRCFPLFHFMWGLSDQPESNTKLSQRDKVMERWCLVTCWYIGLLHWLAVNLPAPDTIVNRKGVRMLRSVIYANLANIANLTSASHEVAMLRPISSLKKKKTSWLIYQKTTNASKCGYAVLNCLSCPSPRSGGV